MSVWTDMMDRGTGDIKKKEDKYLSIDEIATYLESLEVGVGKEAPIRMFSIITEEYKLYTMTLVCIQHTDGKRNFLSAANLNKFNDFIDKTGRILKLM